MASNVTSTGASGASSSAAGGSSTADSDAQIAQMQAGFDRAIAQASKMTQLRQEAGSALSAAQNRLNN